MKESSVRAVTSTPLNLKNHLSKFKLEQEKNVSEDSIDWDIAFSDAEVHDDEGRLLTALVRRTYIDHLQKSLLQNYSIWFKSYGDGVELSESFIARCASELEKKALRACMLASLYQQSVISLIKNIKKSTDNKRLYEDLLTSFNSSKRCDKSIQTHFDQNISSSPIQQPSEISLPKTESTFTPAHSTVDPVNLNQAVVSALSDLDNLFTSKSYLAPPQPVPNPFVVPNAAATSKFVLSYLPKNSSAENKCSRLSNASESSAEVSSSKIYDPEIDIFAEDRIFFEENKSQPQVKRKSQPRESSLKRRKSSFQQAGHQRTLEERLKKFEEIFGDPCEDVPPDPKPPDKSFSRNNYSKFFSLVSWKQEAIAQTCELNNKILQLPSARVRSVRACFKRLFGVVEPVKDITPEDFTHCRKRLANIIVFQLTPYFEFGQIGSRDVFKALARELTRIILNETYAADLAFSQRIVDEIFQNNVKYKTLEDVNILCNR